MSPLVIGAVIVGGYLLLTSPSRLKPSATPAQKPAVAGRSFWGAIDPTVPGSLGNRVIGDVGQALPGLFTSLGGGTEQPTTTYSSLPLGSAETPDTTGLFV